MDIGIIGIGIIGTSFARNLLEDGDVVVAYDIDPQRLDALQGMGGRPAASPREVADSADIVIVALPTLGSLEAVTSGPVSLAASRRPGVVVVDVSTLPVAEKERARANLELAKIEMMDCTISGMGKQVARRDVVFMASGDEEAILKVTPVLSRLGRQVLNVGPFGNGTRMKLLVNMLVAIHTAAAAEGLILAERAGLDPVQVLDVVSSGLANSRSWEVRAPLMIRREYEVPGGPIRNWMKDVALIDDFTRSVGAVTPLFDASRSLIEEADRLGLSSWDAAAVHVALEQRQPEPRYP